MASFSCITYFNSLSSSTIIMRKWNPLFYRRTLTVKNHHCMGPQSNIYHLLLSSPPSSHFLNSIPFLSKFLFLSQHCWTTLLLTFTIQVVLFAGAVVFMLGFRSKNIERLKCKCKWDCERVTDFFSLKEWAVQELRAKLEIYFRVGWN